MFVQGTRARRLLLSNGGRYCLVALLASGCLKPPAAGSGGNAAAPNGLAADGATQVSGYYEPTWGDASGSDGKGGVKLLLSPDKRLPLSRADFDKKHKGDTVTSTKPEWLLFHGPSSDSLALEFVWVTKPDDKFFSNTWAGAGLAFNPSWAAVDATDARYLVLWAKTSSPGVDVAVKLHSVLKSKGKEDTGSVGISDFVPGGKLDDTWRRVVIPLSAFPEIDQVDLKGLQQVGFDVRGGYPENQKVRVLVDNVYITNLEMVTPVTNAGYLVQGDGVLLQWDKDPLEKVQAYAVAVGGKPALKVDGKARSAFVPAAKLGSAKTAAISITTIGASESSDPIQLSVPTQAAPAVSAKVTFSAATHEISPYVFGTNWGPPSSVKDLGVSVRRWGGNRSTKYNWKDDLDSAGVDWFFLNDYAKPKGTPEEKKNYYQFIKETLAGGAEVNFAIPISDWIAKRHPDEKGRYCSYPTSLYPQQEKTDGQGCGNGKKPNGDTIWDNDPNLGMIKNSPELQREFVQSVVKLFGPASKGGVEFYSMDNEPGLWMQTHRDTLPRGITAEQLADFNIRYAGAVKSVDPSAKVIGFGAWGVLELAGSNIDYLPGGTDPHKRQKEKQKDEDRYRERKKHGGDSQLVYLLKRFKQAEAEQGKRLVDVVDIHWYPELYGKNSKGEKKRVLDDAPYDATFSRLQWEALREWYDPSFKPAGELESWTHGDLAADLWNPYHPVIPALKKLLDTYYPGTKLAINEYDTGSPEHYHGALIRAAALGIFMQEDLYMAQNWHQTDNTKFTYFAQKLYGNYDGKGSRVRGKFVPSKSSHADVLTYAAQDGARFTVVLVNKNPTQAVTTALEVPVAANQYRAYTLAETLGLRLLETRGKVDAKRVNVTLPPYSAMLVTTE
jgi:hypothetical protein